MATANTEIAVAARSCAPAVSTSLAQLRQPDTADENADRLYAGDDAEREKSDLHHARDQPARARTQGPPT